MRKRIFTSIFLVALLCIICTSLFTTTVMYNGLYESMELSVQQQGEFLARLLNSGDTSLAESSRENLKRVTLISKEGIVLYDNREQIAEMENHRDRPEIIEAKEQGTSGVKRLSDTMDQTLYYYTIRLDNGDFLRTGDSVQSIYSAMTNSAGAVGIIVFLLGVLTYIVSRKLTKRLVLPLESINLDDPLGTTVYDEMNPLLRRLDDQNKAVSSWKEAVEEKQQETILFLESMQEGLLLLDKNKNIVVVNTSAIGTLTEQNDAYIGKNLLHLSRHTELGQMVDGTLKGNFESGVLTLGKRKTQVRCSPIWEDDQVIGALCLMLDISDTYQTEQLRKEFSATVSHELKTPLTSISGFAEIIQNGLVAQEDIPNFAGKIYSEAQNMILLINDIIKISRLDESNMDLLFEEVEVDQLLGDIVDRLAPTAEKNRVVLSLHCPPIMVEGVPSLLAEVFYNLVENGIKYSPGGTVSVTVREDENRCIISVSDNGDGIPYDQQYHIFERFYRGDKSHSKQTGGTGLGLSIVKHGVNYHKGTVNLSSTPHIGTTMEVILPKKQNYSQTT